jgi:CRISPR-associated protein Cmr6
MPTFREAFARIEPDESSHPGLWLDRFADLAAEAAPSTHLNGFFKQRTTNGELAPFARTPVGYAEFFRQMERGLETLPPHTLLKWAPVQGRMVIGLGGESILETAITLHRTWGVPYLPGSALKGMAARAARRLEQPWAEDSEAFRVVFGDQEAAGFLTFHDALWRPFNDKGRPYPDLPLSQDVMTVHHADYYGHRGHDADLPPPADWDDPNPVPFVSAHGTYLLALTGPKDWLGPVMTILQDALEQDGIGAKTAAGYGRMSVKPWKRIDPA